MIKIYKTTICPYCIKVEAKIKELNLEEGKDYEIINITKQPDRMQELIDLGGKAQVPFMTDNKDIKMYESNAIIKYIEEKFAK